MKTNLLKLYRKHPVLFSLKYGRLIDTRRQVHAIDKLTRREKALADTYWGWDIDRDTYDACIIAAHYLQEFKNEQYEID